MLLHITEKRALLSLEPAFDELRRKKLYMALYKNSVWEEKTKINFIEEKDEILCFLDAFLNK